MLESVGVEGWPRLGEKGWSRFIWKSKVEANSSSYPDVEADCLSDVVDVDSETA